ncbi:MAG: hypothetical protein IT210_13140 [Armatimonadetes bacterium]|nr:hypothetical protein [Armatimonadota bacterium]
MRSRDELLLRDLAQKYAEVCARPVQEERRRLWKQHNSLRGERPLIYVRAFAWHELLDSRCLCEDPFLRHYEDFFRNHLYWDSLRDDSIFEPWVAVQARYRCAGWGVSGRRVFSDTPGGAYKMDYPIKSLEDIEKLQVPRHEIDEEETAKAVRRLQDIIGDILLVCVDRSPAYQVWRGDISTDLGYLRGIENFMLDMSDHPEWLHRLVGFFAEGIRQAHKQAEAAGDWSLTAHQNQAMPYALELPAPAPEAKGVKQSCLWGFMAAQEFALVSPAMWDEFLFRYQQPILERFGLVAYGCCEDLTHKIPVLRRLPNLRRIAVSPFADVARCAEQIGKDYVISYRPSPADMVSYGFDPDRIRRILRRDLAVCREGYVDITLKDVETVQGDRDRPRKWVEITRSIIEEVYG